MRRQTQRAAAARATAALAASAHDGRRRSARLMGASPSPPVGASRGASTAAAASPPAAPRGRPRKAAAADGDAETALRFPHGTLPRTFELEKQAAGFRCVVGVDEAGRGPLAGPVVAAACFVPVDVVIEGVHDSKKLSEPQRELLFDRLTAHPRVRFAVHVRVYRLPASRRARP